MPKQFTWADNYISAFGLLHTDAPVNVILTKGFPGNAASFSSWKMSLEAFHGYPCDWYDKTIQMDVAIVGHLWSFERGGTSTNAQLTVQDMQFFSPVLPSLQVKASSGNVLLSWPLSTAGYVIETSSELTATNSWTTVTNVPAIVDFQNTVTNQMSTGSQFFRLRKAP